MNDLTKIQLRQSEVRQELNKLASLDKPTKEQKTEMLALSEEYDTLETRFQVFAKTQEEEPTRNTEDGEQKEQKNLQNDIELRNYIVAAMDSKPLEGKEKEYNESRGIDMSSINVPWEALIPNEAKDDDRLEARVDTVTNLSSTEATENLQPIIPRIFQRTIARFLGIRMPSVGVGERQYILMSTGTTASMKAKSAEIDAGAATYNVETISPTRLTARYLFQIEDLATVKGLESSLRSDLRSVMSDEYDRQLLTGNGTAPNFAGLFDADSGLADPADKTAVVDVAGAIDAVTGLIDGINAYGPGTIRFLFGPPTIQKLAKTFITSTDTSALDMISRLSGGYRVSARVPAQTASKNQEYLATRNNGIAVSPMWPTLSLIRDVYSGASKGQVALTAIALYGFKIIRTNGFVRGKFKLAT